MTGRAIKPLCKQQRGAVALLASVFLIIAVLVLALVSLRLAATSANDSLLTHDAHAALFLAETAIERAIGQLAGGTVTCGPALAGNWTLGSGSMSIPNIGADFNRDFAGAALPAGRCRIRANGNAGLFNVQRSIEVIVNTSGNLLGGANANFNAPAGACNPPGCTPTGWSLPPGGWQDNGGPDGSRAAYVEKPTTGPSVVTTAGQFSMNPFTFTAPATLTLTFDYRLNTSGGGGQRMELYFRLYSGAAPPYIASPSPFQTSHTGVFQAGSVSFDFTAFSGAITIDALEFDMVASGGQPKFGWLDNLHLSGAGIGTVLIEGWRERVL